MKRRAILAFMLNRPGVLNKVASLLADVVFVRSRESAYFIWSNRCVFSGYPVRDAYMDPVNRSEIRKRLGIEEDARLVLIYGGSIGSRSVNRAVARLGERLSSRRSSMESGIFFASPRTIPR